MPKKIALLGLALALLLTACVSLAGDVTPPPNYKPPTPIPPTPTAAAAAASVAVETPVVIAPTPVAATVTAGATPAPFKVNVTGKVTLSSGAPLPADLKVTLRGYDNMSLSWSATANLEADGSYRFSDVEVVSGRTFLATVEYQKVPFDSDPLHAADLAAGREASLPITVSEVTDDTSALGVQRMHIFLDFSADSSLQVAELMIIYNPGDKAVAAASAEKPALTFDLPAGAENLAFENGVLGDGRYVQTVSGFGTLDPIRPNEQLQVLFGYDMAYTGSQTLSIPINLPVESVVVMIPSDGVTLQSGQLRSVGEREVQGATIQLFSASSLAAGTKLDLNLSGQPVDSANAGASSGVLKTNEVIIGAGVLGVVLILAGVWLYRNRHEESGDQAETAPEDADEIDDNPDAILDAIVALDDLYQAGQLAEAPYQKRRAELKARYKALQGG